MSRGVHSSRRQFLVTPIWLGLSAFIRPYQVWGVITERRRHNSFSSSSSRLVKILRHKESARIIGLEYLRTAPKEADAQILVHLISLGFIENQQDLYDADTERLREFLRLRMRQDFEGGQIIKLKGWMVSVTEARLCALTALI
jgi:hypothetical protein